MKRLLPLLLLPFLVSAASAAPHIGTTLVHVGTFSPTGYDVFRFLGWNDSCSVAISYLSYPPTGKGMAGVPDRWSIGTLTIPAGRVKERESRTYAGITSMAWERKRAQDALRKLADSGYYREGHIERIRRAPVADKPGLAPLIRSTATFKIGYKVPWPRRPYVLNRIRYSPLGTCALFVFRDVDHPRDSYRYKLIQILNPGVRRTRSRAHVTNGLLLYRQDADLYGALDELSIASEMDPSYALARYHHSLFLAAHGRYDDAFSELKAAGELDDQFLDKAETAVELETLRKDRRFKMLLSEHKKEKKRKEREKRRFQREREKMSTTRPE